MIACRCATISFMRCCFSVLLLLFSFPGLNAQLAPGAPGQMAHWTSGNKQGVGTSNSLNSHVWFTLGPEGALNEVCYPTVDKAKTWRLELVVTAGNCSGKSDSEVLANRVDVPGA